MCEKACERLRANDSQKGQGNGAITNASYGLSAAEVVPCNLLQYRAHKHFRVSTRRGVQPFCSRQADWAFLGICHPNGGAFRVRKGGSLRAERVLCIERVTIQKKPIFFVEVLGTRKTENARRMRRMTLLFCQKFQ